MSHLKLISCTREEKGAGVDGENTAAVAASHRHSLEQAAARNTHLQVFHIFAKLMKWIRKRRPLGLQLKVDDEEHKVQKNN